MEQFGGAAGRADPAMLEILKKDTPICLAFLAPGDRFKKVTVNWADVPVMADFLGRDSCLTSG